MPPKSPRRPAALLTGLLLLAAGCSTGNLEFAEVEGVVYLGKKTPLPGVRVTFMPDPQRGTPGQTSSGYTDAGGKFKLQYYSDPDEGAVVGWHRIILEDTAAEERGKVIKVRIHPKYSTPQHTPLKYQVQSGEQQVVLYVNSPYQR